MGWCGVGGGGGGGVGWGGVVWGEFSDFHQTRLGPRFPKKIKEKQQKMRSVIFTKLAWVPDFPKHQQKNGRK